MKKKILGFVILILVLNFKVFSENNISLSYKNNNEIITNIDIINESKYLLALNTDLKNLDNKRVLQIAERSIVRENIKKIELLKYFDLNKENKMVNKFIKNFYSKLNLNNEQEFIEYLNDYNLTMKGIKNKINIEISWNQLVYDKYNKQINIDLENLKKKIKLQKNLEFIKSYKLSEIYFEKNDESINETYEKIKESIKEIGFKNTATIYSISESAKFGGELPWVEEKNLTNKLSVVLKTLPIGSHTEPMIVGNKFLIINVDQTKDEKIEIDEEKELKIMIEYERDRQLEKFSKIYFDKIKINTIINEL